MDSNYTRSARGLRGVERMLAVERLKNLLDGNEAEAEYNGVVITSNGSKITVSATGLFTPPVSFELNSVQLRLLRGFLEFDDGPVHVIKLENGVRLGFEWVEGFQTALDLLEDGTSVAHEYWGSIDWDRWTVFPDGSTRYTGDLNESRCVPEWVERAVMGLSLIHI